jgi:hypothetical protein
MRTIKTYSNRAPFYNALIRALLAAPHHGEAMLERFQRNGSE